MVHARHPLLVFVFSGMMKYSSSNRKSIGGWRQRYVLYCHILYSHILLQVKWSGGILSLDSQREHIFDSEVGTLLVKTCRNYKQAVVESILEKSKTKSPPQALHTVELLRSASSKLHIGPKQAMDVAERLYIDVGCASDHDTEQKPNARHNTDN